MNDRPIRRLASCETPTQVSSRRSRELRENALQRVGIRNLWFCSVCGEVAHSSRLILDPGARFPVCEDADACTNRVVSRGALWRD